MLLGRRDLATSALAATSAAPPVSAKTTTTAQTATAPADRIAGVTQPADGVIMPEGYARATARFAHIWGRPPVTMTNRRAAIRPTSRSPTRAGSRNEIVRPA